MASLYNAKSKERKLKMDEVEEVMNDIALLLETRMESYSETATGPRLAAVDGFLDAMMITTAPPPQQKISTNDMPEETPLAEDDNKSVVVRV
jgi:hypothetical protein